MRRFVAYGPASVVMLTALVVLLAAPAAVRRIHYATLDTRIQLARQVVDDDDLLERMNRAVRNIAISVQPSVVHIEARSRNGFQGSTGSGWIYDGDGHVVTNAHVVRDSDRFFISFSDGRVVEASLVGLDPYTDIAVLRANATTGLFPVRRASGERLSQGDRVFAFGSPFGFKFSMSEGIVSGLGRNPDTAIELGGYTNFIQSDAAVNPGNSGGPLVDIRGRVVGMNVAIATGAESRGTQQGQYAGISFAIPVSTIDAVVPQLIGMGRVARGYLGVNYSPSNNLNDEDEGLVPVEGSPFPVGLRIGSVVEGTPADEAGLKEGDVLVEIRGQRVVNADVLRSVVGSARPGDRIAVRVFRNGDILPLEIVLGEFPPRLLASQLLQSFGLVQIADTERGIVIGPCFGLAARAGFRPGMRVVRVGKEPVARRDDMLDAMVDRGLLEGESVSVTVLTTDEEGEDVIQSLDVRLGR